MKFVLTIAVCLFVARAAFSVIEVSNGVAYNTAGEVLYTEKHTSEISEGRLQKLKTEYFDKNKKNFAILESDFKKRKYLPAYKSEDFRFGRVDGIKNIDGEEGKVLAYAIKGKGEKEISKKFKVKNDLISGQGLHAYMFANLPELLKSSKPKKIKFLIPMNQDSYNFLIVKKSVKENKARFKVKINSWFLSLFAPSLEVVYEVGTNRLLEFNGPSNLLDENKKTQNVKIVYTYKKQK